jgi:hypothetical protein
MKKFIFSFCIFFSISTNSFANPNDQYLDIFHDLNVKFGLAPGMNFVANAGLSPEQIATELRAFGLDVNNSQVNQLISAQATLSGLPSGMGFYSALAAAFPSLSPSELAIIDIITSSGFYPEDGLQFIFAHFGYAFVSLKSLLLLQAQVVLRPTSPSSPVAKSLKLTISKILKSQSSKIKTKSSGSWFDDLYAEIDYAYTTFENTVANDSGRSHSKGITFGAQLFQNTDLSFSIGHTDLRQRGVNDLISESYSYSFSLHHKINDNFGFGAYGFYVDSDLEEIDSHIASLGGGAFISTSHDIGDLFTLSTVNSITYVHTDFLEDDYIYTGAIKVQRSITDSITLGAYAYYTDSVTAKDYDTSYWTTGIEMNIAFTESLHGTVSYDKTLSLAEYREETIYFSMLYYF